MEGILIHPLAENIAELFRGLGINFNGQDESELDQEIRKWLEEKVDTYYMGDKSSMRTFLCLDQPKECDCWHPCSTFEKKWKFCPICGKERP